MRTDLDRLLVFVGRELGAREVVVLAPEDVEPEDVGPGELRGRLPDGRTLVVRFETPPDEAAVKQRRLDMLIGTFCSTLATPAGPPSTRPPAAVALEEELLSLCGRAGAINALVIDANSPVVWGASDPRGLSVGFPEDPAEEPGVAAPPPDPGSVASGVSSAALGLLRSAYDLGLGRKGKHVRHIERAGDSPFLAHCFAGIYWLVLAYDSSFDELRAERAVLEALPRVERLVMALPPMDPPPGMGAGAVVRMRRR